MFLPKGMLERRKCYGEIGSFSLLDGPSDRAKGAGGGGERAHATVGMIRRPNSGIGPSALRKDEATLSGLERPTTAPKGV